MFDADLHRAWQTANHEGRHDENLRLVERSLSAQPDDPDLHLLRAMSLSAVGREGEAHAAVHRAIDNGQDDAAVLVRAASMCFFEADLAMARCCVDRAKRIAPRGFLLRKELKELDRNLSRREEGLDIERRLSRSFNAEPSDRQVATDFARHLVRTGRTYVAYHVIARGLRYHPDDRSLRRLKKKAGKIVPDAVRAEAEEWAASGEPTTNLSWRSGGGNDESALER